MSNPLAPFPRERYPDVKSTAKTIFDALPEGEAIVLRPSDIVDFDNCSYATAFKRAKIRPEATAAALLFGTAVHEVILLFVGGNAKAAELPGLFEALWTKARDTQAIRYSSIENWDSLLQIGRKLMEYFPQWWQKAGFRPVRMPNGKFAMELRLDVQIEPNLIVSSQPDIVAEVTLIQVDPSGYVMARPGDVVILDWKSPRAASSIEFAQRSVQPTYYKIAGEAHAALLGIDRIAAVGYVELLKQKTRTVITHPFLYPRTDLQVRQAVAKAKYVANRIRQGLYLQESKMAFNSPCNLCDFAGACLSGDDDGLVLPEGISKKMLVNYN